VRRDEDQPAVGRDGVERAEDRGVPDGVRHHAGVELGQAGLVVAAAAAAVPARRGRGGCGLRDVLPEGVVHLVQQIGQGHRRGLGEHRQDQLVLLAQVAGEQRGQCGARGRGAHHVGGGGDLVDEADELDVLAEHRVDQQPGPLDLARGRVDGAFLGGGVRQQLGLAPADQLVAGLPLGGLVGAARGGEQRGDPGGERAGQLRVVLLDRGRGGGVRLAGGQQHVGHVGTLRRRSVRLSRFFPASSVKTSPLRQAARDIRLYRPSRPRAPPATGAQRRGSLASLPCPRSGPPDACPASCAI
jgi:hypothetical protein